MPGIQVRPKAPEVKTVAFQFDQDNLNEWLAFASEHGIGHTIAVFHLMPGVRWSDSESEWQNSDGSYADVDDMLYYDPDSEEYRKDILYKITPDEQQYSDANLVDGNWLVISPTDSIYGRKINIYTDEQFREKFDTSQPAGW